MSRIFFLVGLSYLATSYLMHYFSEDLWIYILITLIILSIFSCFIKKFRNEKAIPVSLLVCSLAALINILNFNFNILNIQKLDEKDAFISAKIIDIPYKKNNKYNYILKVESLNNKKVSPFKLKLSSSTTLEAEAYDTFKGRVHFFLPQNDIYFNQKLYYKANGIHILAYAYNYEPFEITPQKSLNLNCFILKFRKKMLSLPKYIFNDQIGNIINGFLLGEKHNFPADIKENFSNIGLLNPKINKFICEKLKIDKSNKILNYFISLVSVSSSVAIFTFPLTAMFFKKETLLFVISNILVIPVSTLLLSLIVVLQACLLLSLPKFVTMPIGSVCGVLTNLIVDISNLLSKVPFASISLNYRYFNVCLICCLFIIGISLLFKNYKKILKISIPISASIFIAGTIIHIILSYNITKIAVINCSEGLALVISEKFKKSAIVFYDENFNDTYFKEYFLRTSGYLCDYFNIISPTASENLSSSFLSTINNFRTLNLKNINFNQKNIRNLWNHINISTHRINKYVFILIQINETKILISCNGGDISQLPEKYKTCDFFIAGKLPINYELLQTNRIIISANKNNSEIFLNKLLSSKKKLFSTAHEGNIYINIDKNKSIIRRFE